MDRWLVFLLALCSCCCVPAVCEQQTYINKFAVHIDGGDLDANTIAERHGYVNHGQVGSLKGYYVFEHHDIHKRSLEYSHHHHRKLKNEPQVKWVEQLYEKRRVKRDGKNDVMSESTTPSDDRQSRSLAAFSDPLYSEQWYLHKGAWGGNDMNVGPVWEEGITGKGVVVTILDDGIQHNHPDLSGNYDPEASSDINGQDDDPMPQDNNDNKHGTRCAGEVAATAYNEFCGVGIAYNASIGGVRMLDGTVTDEVEARALALNPNHIDIYSASWGPEDDGKTVDGPGRMAKRAFIDGITFGRNGLGSIFVWASGNGGRHQDNCNCDGYTNSIYTLSISSATQAGAKPWYLEECSSTLTTTYSSGTPRQDENIVTVDMDTSFFRDLQNRRIPNKNNLCTKSHTGTSASAPIAAAICALSLEANPRLTWRDMQHLVVLTSRPEPLSREDGWVTNGVGRKVNHKFGYGLMDAAGMVRLAKQWTPAPPQRSCHTPSDKQERIISNQYGEKLEVSLVTDGCRGSSDGINYLEHVQVVISLQYQPRGNLHIILISPSGTASSVLLPRPFDSVESSIVNWPFLSVHFWGENPIGHWKLVIINEGRLHSNIPGKLKEWSLIFYGTDKQPTPLASANHRNRHYSSYVRETTQTVENPCASQGKFQLIDKAVCYTFCPEGYYGDSHRICQPCQQSCQQCYGPGRDHCLSCPTGLYLSKNDNCLETCPERYFNDLESGDCLPCPTACATCNEEICMTCRPKHYYYQQQCHRSCPAKTYSTQDNDSNKRCNSCHVSCLSCRGPSRQDCITCQSGAMYNGTCVNGCPPAHYEDGSQHACFSCGSGCESCEGAGSCSSCREGWDLSAGNCYPHSPDNCQPGLYFEVDTMACIPCHSTCKTCTGHTASACVECPQGRFYHEMECLDACPLGTFSSHAKSVCLKCPSTCFNCSDFHVCRKCTPGLVLHQNECLLRCPEGWFLLDGSCSPCHDSCSGCRGPNIDNCTRCQYGSYLLGGLCRNSCPNGFYPSSHHQQCLACHHLCASCSGPGPLSCTSCHKNAFLVNGICHSCLNNEFYDMRRKICLNCHSSCANCTGPLESDCLSCAPTLHMKLGTGSCLPCCQPDQLQTHHTDQCCSCGDDDSEQCGGYFSDKTRSILAPDRRPGELPFQEHQGLVIPLRDVLPVVVGICASAVILFFVLFGALQMVSHGIPCGTRSRTAYKRVPVMARYDGSAEKVALTQNQDDDEEEDELFEKT